MKKVSKSSMIRALFDKGLTNSEIVNKLRVSPQLVYLVKKNMDIKRGKAIAVKRITLKRGKSKSKVFEPMPLLDRSCPRILRFPQVKEITGLSRSSLYALFNSNQFPMPVKLTSRCIGWLASDIDNWMSSLKPVTTSEIRSVIKGLEKV
jgi:prophage regulatory protein